MKLTNEALNKEKECKKVFAKKKENNFIKLLTKICLDFEVEDYNKEIEEFLNNR